MNNLCCLLNGIKYCEYCGVGHCSECLRSQHKLALEGKYFAYGPNCDPSLHPISEKRV